MHNEPIQAKSPCHNALERIESGEQSIESHPQFAPRVLEARGASAKLKRMFTNQDNSDVALRLEAAVEFARLAGETTLEFFRNDELAVDRKSDDSPVTEADRKAEQLLRELIGKRFADDAIVGEEFGETAGTSGFCWVLDPIDGTKSFIHGIPLYTTLIGLLDVAAAGNDQGRPVAGVIHAPALAETAWAATGMGASYQRRHHPPQPCRVSTAARLSEALMVTSEVKTFADGRSADETDVYLRLQNACRLARTWGDGYGYLMVATGRADIAIDPRMNLWDAAALQPIIEEAGGQFTDWNGEATVHAGESLATNGKLHEEVIATIKG